MCGMVIEWSRCILVHEYFVKRLISIIRKVSLIERNTFSIRQSII
jgi:hypothetical protein